MQTRVFWFLGLVLVSIALILQEGTQLFAAQVQPGSPTIAVPAAAPTSTPPHPGVRGPFVGKPVAPASFNGDVRRLAPQSRAPVQRRQVPRPLLRRTPNTSSQAQLTPFKLARQAQVGKRQPLALLQQFNGLSENGWVPPSPNGDVGPNDYVQAVNIEIAIYNKTGDLQASLTYDDLFKGGPLSGTPCGDSNNRGDVIVVYDPTVDRWIAADMAHYDNSSGDPEPPYYECIAVSESGDPVSGGWYLYALPIAGDLFNDFAKLGVWSDGIYMSANMFDSAGNYFENARVWALNRADLISGAALENVYFDLSGQYASLLPANLRGSTMPPDGEPEFFASIDQPSTFHLWKFHVDWDNPTSSSITGPTDLTVNTFAEPCDAAWIFPCVPELNGERVDALGDRLSMQMQYRNINGTESLWANHSVAADENVGTQIGLRWYEIRDPNSTPTIYQQGTYMPADSSFRWVGSLAVDHYGDMALGYSVSSASMHPAIRYTGRWFSDSLGSLGQGEATVLQGTGSQVNGYYRWGDYSSMTIDSTDDCTFWYTNEYYTTTGGGWQTRISSFKIAPWCTIGWPAPVYTYDFPVVLKDTSP